MAEEKHSEQGTKSTGLGLGVGLNLDLDLDLKLAELKNTLTMLTDTLRETGGAVTGIIADAVNKFREAGVENLKHAAEKDPEQKELYDRIVSNLQTAASQGEEKARSLLKELGENVESTGQRMQGAAESEEARH